MARYSKIGVQVWSDERFRKLSKARPNAQTLWFYLLANPARSSLSGLIISGEMMLAEGLEWSLASLRRCWQEIETQKMAYADWKARLIWVPKMVKWDPPNGPNVAVLWGRQLRSLPDCQLRDQAEAFIDAFLNGISDAIHKAFRYGVSMPSGMAYRIPPPTPPPTPPPGPPPSPMPSHRPGPPEHPLLRNDDESKAPEPDDGAPRSKPLGAIKNSTADLSYWDEGNPPPLDPESAELLKKAILKPMSEILKSAEQRKAELRKPKTEQAE